MISASHVVFAQALYYPTCILYGHIPSFSETLLCIMSSLFPDIDTKQSFTGRILPFLSEYIEDNYGHRTVTHSFVLILLVSIPLGFLTPIQVHLPIIVGLTSHSVADMFTKAGVQFWWPFSRARCVCWKNTRLRIEVYSFGEWIFTACMVVSIFITYRFAHVGYDLGGIIQQAFGEVQMSAEAYQKTKGENLWWCDIRGRSNFNQAKVDGRYEVVDVAGSSFFLDDGMGRVVSAGQTSETDWYVNYLSLVRGPAEIIRVADIQLDSVTQENFLSTIQVAVVNADKFYLKGEFVYRARGGDAIAVRLNYERLERVKLLSDVAYLEKVSIQLIVRGGSVVEPLQLSFQPVTAGAPLSIDDKWQMFLGNPTTTGW